jgi:hypothetical protein
MLFNLLSFLFFVTTTAADGNFPKVKGIINLTGKNESVELFEKRSRNRLYTILTPLSVLYCLASSLELNLNARTIRIFQNAHF